MNDSSDYEKFVRSITEALLRAQGLETIEVKHDVQVQGTSRSHQVDVYWEYRLGGVTHRVVINCKRYSSSVEGTDVFTLKGVLDDIPGARGIIVTTVGFQKGAIAYAKTHGIGLKVIRPPIDDDFEGTIRTVEVTMQLSIPELRGLHVKFNAPWIRSTLGVDPATKAGPIQGEARLIFVHDLDAGTRRDINDLWNEAMRANPTEPDSEGAGTLSWPNAMFERPDAEPLKVDSMTFTWFLRQRPDELMVFKMRDPKAIVQDALSGALLYVDDDGRITGDVEAELGRKP